MFIPTTNYQSYSVGDALVQLSRLAAGPAFELQFSKTQEAVLDRLDREIETLQAVKLQDGLTAHLDLQISDLQREINRVDDYHSRTKTNGINTDTVTSLLTQLNGLADPSTIAAFDAALAETIDGLNKIHTRFPEPFGIHDGLRSARDAALTTLQALNHNNFATPQDITDVQTALSTLSASFVTPRSVLTQNQTAAFNLLDNNGARITDIQGQIVEIKGTAQTEQLDKIQATRERFSTILTVISLAFEGSQSIANFVADNTILRRTTAEPGTVLSLFA